MEDSRSLRAGNQQQRALPARAQPYTIEEAAKYLRHGVSTLRGFIATGRIPAGYYAKGGRRYLFTQQQLDGILEYWSTAPPAPRKPPVRRRRPTRTPAL